MSRPSALRQTWRLLKAQTRIWVASLRDPEAAERAQFKLDLWRHQQRELRAARRAPTLREIEERPAWVERHPRRRGARLPFDGDHFARARTIDDLGDA